MLNPHVLEPTAKVLREFKMDLPDGNGERLGEWSVSADTRQGADHQGGEMVDLIADA